MKRPAEKEQLARSIEQCKKLYGLGMPLSSGHWIGLVSVCLNLVQIVTDIEQRGVGFVSLTEKIETSSAARKMVFHVFAALAEFERSLIRERTQPALAVASSRGGPENVSLSLIISKLTRLRHF